MKKTSFALVAGGLALMALSSVSQASVLHTKHNFSSTNTGGAFGGGTAPGGQYTTETTEICVFCHTPHGGDQTAYAPLWNRAQTTATFVRFSSLNRWSFDSAEAPVGTVSLACLSCHDGTQAVSSVINTAGSDTTGHYSMSEFSQMAGTLDAPNGSLASRLAVYGQVTATHAAMGDMIFIGTDLSNDHPISMQYGGGGLASGHAIAATNDPDYAQAAAAGTGGPGGLVHNNTSHAGANNSNGGNVDGSGTGLVRHDTNGKGGFADRWWVDANGVDGFQNGGDMPLYTRNDITGGGAVVQPTVECGTCHDPHSGNTTFLRIPGNENSQVCLTCHAK